MPLVTRLVDRRTASRLGDGDRLPAGPRLAADGPSTSASASICRRRSSRRGDLAATVATVLSETGFSPPLLELEVTENILLEDDEAGAATSSAASRTLGVHIAFDDFGTGYASLTYLKKFPLDRLKIDQSFVRELRADSPTTPRSSSCTISLGKLLGLSVIAEGIEDAATAELLQEHGLRGGAGLLFRPPMPAAEFEKTFFVNGDLSHPRADEASVIAAAVKDFDLRMAYLPDGSGTGVRALGRDGEGLGSRRRREDRSGGRCLRRRGRAASVASVRRS